MAERPEQLELLRIAVEALAQRIDRLERQKAAASATSSALQRASDRGFGARAINRVGALTVALGVIFFFKYAVDEDLIKRGVGVCLGLLFSVVMVIAGDLLNRRDQKVFAQGITGCGLAAGYTTLYASFAFYRLIPAGLGYAGLLLVSLGSVILALRYANQAIAAIGFLGGLLAPVLLNYGHPDLASNFAYFLFVQATALVLVLRQRWAVLAPLAAGTDLLCAAVLFGTGNKGWVGVLALSLGLLHFAAATRKESAAEVLNGLLSVGHCCLLITGFCFVHLFVTPASVARELDSLLLACYGIALLAYGLTNLSSLCRVFGSVLLGLVIAKLYLFDVWNLARGYRVTAFVGLGVLLLLASYLYSKSEKRSTSS